MDVDIKNHLISILEKVNVPVYVFKDPRFNANLVMVGGQEFYFYMMELVKHFNFEALSFSKDFLLGVLSGFIDADGCVYNGIIQIAQKDGTTIRKMQEICNMLNVNCTLKEKSNRSPSGKEGRIWRGYVSTSFKYLPHVSQKVIREYAQ